MTDPCDSEIVHRELDTDREEPAIAIAEVVADLDGTPINELPVIYDCIGGMLSGLYSNPPAPEAQMTIKFTYSGYRIRVDQSGTAEFSNIA